MADGLNITHGGVVEVDPAALRLIADGVQQVSQRFGEAADAAREAFFYLRAIPDPAMRDCENRVCASALRADEMRTECATMAANCYLMADVYELVERRQELAALAVSDSVDAVLLNARIDFLLASDPRVGLMEKAVLADWKRHRYDGLNEQPLVGGMSLPIGEPLRTVYKVASMMGTAGAGVVLPGAKLKGDSEPVTVTPLKTTNRERPAPPQGLADALSRVENIEDGQIKIERYEMPDGTNRFVLYEKGTQTPLSATDPFDMQGNIDLYTGNESESYRATVEALKMAGAQPGDQVDVVAHSQAAMNAAYLASSGEFDVKVQVTAGSPVQPILDDDQTLVSLQHTDDVVRSLSGGGLPGGTGTDDSVLITRVGDPSYGISELGFKPHMLDTYIETAELADASGDQRLESVQQNWDELEDATSSTTTEYKATRE